MKKGEITITTYQPNIPTGLVDLDVDYQNLQNNFSQLDTTYGVDHIKFSTVPNNGYHTNIHQVPLNPIPTSTPIAVAPAPIAGINQLFSLNWIPDATGAVSDTQLFARTGLGGFSQLTGGNIAQEGWQWVGGILVQWGRITQNFSSGGTSGTVAFKDRQPGCIPFPTTCFMVQTTPFITGSNPGSQATAAVRTDSLLTGGTGFNWRFFTNSSDYQGFFWTAIGN